MSIWMPSDRMMVLPEIVLAVGAMACLMIGAFRNQDSFDLVSTLTLLLFAGVGALIIFGPTSGSS